jgi:ribulose-5-phosphate 4-epimerase/fuculose-1-phosphate aldolase
MDSVETDKLESKAVICHLLKKFYDKGWFTGSGGGISIRESDDCIYIAPSGVQKEYVTEQDIYKLNIKTEILKNPKDKCLTMS